MKRMLLYFAMICLAPLALAAQSQFPLPPVPDTLRSPEQRADYLLAHYWDSLEYAGANIASIEIEQAFSDYASVLPIGSAGSAVGSVCRLMDGLSANAAAYRHFASLAEKYLYDSQSPVRNDSLFILFLQHELASPHLDDAEKSRLRFLHSSLLANAPGTKAADFHFTLADGTAGSLYSACPGKYMVVMFYDPDCEHCRNVMFDLRYNSALNLRLRQGKVHVLAVYAEGNDSVWQAFKHDLPAQWMTATDHGTVKAANLYDLRAMPAVYLLDAERNVVLKNAASRQIGRWLLDSMPSY